MGDLSTGGTANRALGAQIAGRNITTPMVQLMGDPLANLLASAGIDPSQIGLSQAGGADVSQVAPVQQPDQAPGLLPTMLGQTPQQPDNQYTDFDPVDVAKSVPQIGSPDDSVTIQGDAWKPHRKPHGLGAIANFLLGNAIGRGNDERDLESALRENLNQPGGMSNIANAPQIISRIAQFNPKLAISLADKYVDNTRQQSNVNRQLQATDLVVDKYVRDRAAGIANTLSSAKNPQQAWPILRQRIIGFGKQYGKDFSGELPDQYSDLDINAFVNGGMSVPQAERLKQGERKLDQGDRRLDQGDTRLGMQGKDIDSKITTREAQVNQGQQRIDLSKNKPANQQDQIVPTKNGNMIVRGNKGTIITPDGMAHLFMTNDGTHWVHINTVPTKGVKKQ